MGFPHDNSNSPFSCDNDAIALAASGSHDSNSDSLQGLSSLSSNTSTSTPTGRAPNSMTFSSATSLDLRGPSNETSPVGNQVRSAEKILNEDRKLHGISDQVKIDGNFDSVDAEKLKKSAICLTIKVYNTVEKNYVHYEGQASIIQNPSDENERYFCTAKHNLVSEDNAKGQLEKCKYHLMNIPGGTECEIELPGTGWKRTDKTFGAELRDGETWATGFDVSLGPRADIRSVLHNEEILELVNEVVPFIVVDNKFVYKEGMKVAVVVYSRDGPHAKKLVDFQGDDARIRNFFGEPKDVLILTGEITKVGNFHIEYNVNTFGGCSGATVILLDEGEYHGCALATHVGFKAAFGQNVGFKLKGIFENPDICKKEE